MIDKNLTIIKDQKTVLALRNLVLTHISLSKQMRKNDHERLYKSLNTNFYLVHAIANISMSAYDTINVSLLKKTASIISDLDEEIAKNDHAPLYRTNIEALHNINIQILGDHAHHVYGPEEQAA